MINELHHALDAVNVLLAGGAPAAPSAPDLVVIMDGDPVNQC